IWKCNMVGRQGCSIQLKKILKVFGELIPCRVSSQTGDGFRWKDRASSAIDWEPSKLMSQRKKVTLCNIHQPSLFYSVDIAIGIFFSPSVQNPSLTRFLLSSIALTCSSQ